MDISFYNILIKEIQKHTDIKNIYSINDEQINIICKNLNLDLDLDLNLDLDISFGFNTILLTI